MKFEYTGRHVDVTPALRQHVEDHFKKIEQLFTDSTARAHVILDVEKNRQTGEILVHWREHTLTARETNSDMYQALTRAIDKIEKQALKLKKKIIGRKHSATPLAQVAPAPEGETLNDGAGRRAPRSGGNGTGDAPKRIISARRYSVKPMTPEEAALRLADAPDQFIVFRDAETSRVGVLYKRKDGNYGLIEP